MLFFCAFNVLFSSLNLSSADVGRVTFLRQVMLFEGQEWSHFAFLSLKKKTLDREKKSWKAESFIQLISAALKTVARFKKGEKNRKAEKRRKYKILNLQLNINNALPKTYN